MEKLLFTSESVTEGHPDKFTYIHYGNNLGENGNALEGNIYQNQFRFYTEKDFLKALPAPKTDYKGNNEDLKWTITKVHQTGATNKNNDGSFTLSGWKAAQSGIIMIEATAGDDPETQVTVRTPLFVQCCSAVNQYTIEYTPLVPL